MPLTSRSRRSLLAALAAVACAAPFASAFADNYPARPVTLVVFGTPGGITDQLGRLVAQRVGERLGQPVIVENKPGAGGNVAAESVVRGPADGYTIFLGTQGSQATNQFLYKSIRFDPEKDFVPVHALVSIPNILVVNASRPYKSVKELVDYAAQHPDKLSAGSAGTGTGTHLALELFNSVAGVKITHVPYKGSSPSIQDLVGGQVDLAFDYPVSTMSQIQAGKLRALAVTGAKRYPALPQVPTIAEAGYPAAEATSWLGLFFPAKTPAPIVERWQSEVARMMQDPSFPEAVGRMGGVPLDLAGAKFGSFVDAERVKWKAIVQRSGAKVD